MHRRQQTPDSHKVRDRNDDISRTDLPAFSNTEADVVFPNIDDSDRSLRSAKKRQSEFDDEPFVWKKRDQMLRKKGIRLTPADDEARRCAAARELERAKALREDRQREREEWEAEQSRLARVREQELNSGWDRKEDGFHAHQHFLRQAIRLRENRPSLADSLARNVRLDLLEVQPDPRPPHEIIVGAVKEVTRADLMDLRSTIELELDYIPDFPRDEDTEIFNPSLRYEWWYCLAAFVSDVLDNFTDSSDAEESLHGPIHKSLRNELDGMLSGKPIEQLYTMDRDVSRRISVEPWTVKGSGASHEGSAMNRGLVVSAASQKSLDPSFENFGDIEFWQAALGKIRRKIAAEHLLELNMKLAQERKRMLTDIPSESTTPFIVESSSGVGGADAELNGDAMVRAEAAKGMRENEELFADVVPPPKRRRDEGYAWNDKYRPRKPKFFNRVHTGYDWNKYNRTHYDHDNPPPKTVQGYKFNIFYPDLIDRSVTPTFKLTQTDNPEVCVITFKAGPPYEDIAFKIVNRPWEHSHRRGFRCTFDRNTLHLWFNFRRFRYRR